jgi:RNA polymerase sigma-70 factor (ECF subfamily)
MIMSEMSDQELLRTIGQGEKPALSLLYGRYAARLFGLILQIVKNRNDAEDVLQETFLQIWQKAHQYDSQKSQPEVWLLLLARSRAIDRCRKHRPVSCDPTDIDIEQLVPPDAMALLAEVHVEVCSALRQLSPEQQLPLHLAFFEGMTHTEIAERLQIPLGTVKTRIRTGMMQMKQKLNSTGVSN